ncbi:hypothetical protein [Prolixibacter sp. NT017]|uniref:hypothetical protein n=1 Tax=Prolixibacter sp. NT017 TaxID=2652390 RepID=UPI001282C7D9|nr:hypothetical protein [Prolixibacter sp. NT017]GET25183.1 hypothetical protein NT017_15120 [Prolixibacter sp. NT017]
MRERKIYYSKTNSIINVILTLGILITGLVKIKIEGQLSEVLMLSIIGIFLCYWIYRNMKHFFLRNPVVTLTDDFLKHKNFISEWKFIESIEISRGFFPSVTIHYIDSKVRDRKMKSLRFQLDELKISKNEFEKLLKEYYK